MTVRRAVQPVDGLGRDGQRRVEADCRVRVGNVVVNRFGQRDDVESGVQQPLGAGMRAAAAQADQRVQVQVGVVLADLGRSYRSSDRQSATCAACRGWCPGSCRRGSGSPPATPSPAPPPGSPPGRGTRRESPTTRMHIPPDGSLAHRANRRVQPWAVAPSREDANAARSHAAATLRVRPRISRPRRMPRPTTLHRAGARCPRTFGGQAPVRFDWLKPLSSAIERRFPDSGLQSTQYCRSECSIVILNEQWSRLL